VRIALVAPFGLQAKGTARARTLPLGKELAARGHTVSLFVPPYDSPQDDGKQWSEDGVAIVNARLPSGRSGPLWHMLLGWRLFSLVRGWQPDVVHVFKPKGPSGLVATGYHIARSGARLVVDADDWEGPGGWNDDPRAGYSPVQRRFFAWQERYGLSHADAWTVASACLRQRAAGFGADRRRIYLLPNGLSDLGLRLAAQEPDSAASARRDPRCALLYTRFAGVAPSDVTAVWARVTAAVPAARLTVVGHGVGGEEAVLASTPGVTVAGWLEPTAMPALFARMGVAIVPWHDSPANRARHSAKVLELMAAGLPVVAYAIGELPATLGETARLIPPGDAAGFAAAVIELMNDPAQAHRLGAAARQRVVEKYRWDVLADSTLAAYGE
jgi:glycosyltransferase involved in cell wall biosynthesis